MIRILGYKKGSAPSRERILAALPAQWLTAWRAHHGEARNGAHTEESLAALYLLFRLHPTGTLAYEAGGRPYFVEGDADFSITHACGASFCAVSDGAERVGLDAEHLSRGASLDCRGLASRFFSDGEYALFEAGGASSAVFLRIWTRKEALVKQSGKGLSGLRAADSTAARGVAFFEERLDDLLLTLAHGGVSKVCLDVVK